MQKIVSGSAAACRFGNRRWGLKARALASAACLFLAGNYAEAQDKSLVPPVEKLVDAFLAIQEFGAIRPSPDGSMLAVEVARPRSLRSRPGIVNDQRTDLWVINVSTGAVRKLTSSAEDGSASWSPLWSPDSRRLAFLSTAGDGLPRAGWADVTSGKRGLISERGVDVEVNFGSRSPYFGDGRVWGVWTGADAFLMAALADGEINPTFRASAPDLVYPPLWARTREGKPSVTVWDSKTNPICSQKTSLIATKPGGDAKERELLKGSVRAVTVSPDKGRAAVVVATEALPPPALGKFDEEFSYQNLDPRVRTKLALVALNGGKPVPGTAAGGGFRFQSAEDAPRWSRDSRTVYAPSFDTTDKGAGNFCVGDAGIADGRPHTGGCTKVRSRRHAQLLSLSLAAAPPASKKELEERIARTAASADLSADPLGIDVSIFAIGPDRVGMANARSVRLIDLKSGRTLDSLDIRDGATLLTGAPSSGATSAVIQTSNGVSILRADGDRLSLQGVKPRTSRFTPASMIPGSNEITWIERSAEGQLLWISDARGRVFRKAMSLARPDNAAIGDIRGKAFHYSLPDGRPAVAALLLPPGYDASKRYPVILDVYPFRDYSEASAERSFDPALIHDVDYYALASRGYVIARPSLPDFKGDVSSYEPLSYYADLIEGFANETISKGLGSEGRIGLWGISNGGYLGLATAARTKKIGAIVSFSPFPDLMSSDERPGLVFSPDNCAPNRFYGGQIAYAEDPDGPFWRIGAPSYAAFDRYVRNSPIYQMGPQTPATLLVQGEFDSRGTADVERVFTRLARQGVPVQLARYWGEGHTFETGGNIRDRVQREISWFDSHLLEGVSVDR